MRTALILLFLLGASQARSQSPLAIRENNKGAQLLEQNKNMEALGQLSRTVVDRPQLFEGRYNLGLAFEKNKEPEKAIREYLEAAKSPQDSDLKFQAFFNAARIRGDQKKTEEAVGLYQKALAIHPDSIEVKTNIELLLSKQGQSGEKDKTGQGGSDGEKKDPKQDNPGQDQKKSPQPTPQPFQSKDLSQQDVKNILDELRRQENKARAKEFDKKPKEPASGHDW